MNKYYVTLGCGQPYYPGYFVIYAYDMNYARAYARKELDNKYCSIYTDLYDVHPYDRVYRGDIDSNNFKPI